MSAGTWGLHTLHKPDACQLTWLSPSWGNGGVFSGLNAWGNLAYEGWESCIPHMGQTYVNLCSQHPHKVSVAYAPTTILVAGDLEINSYMSVDVSAYVCKVPVWSSMLESLKTHKAWLEVSQHQQDWVGGMPFDGHTTLLALFCCFHCWVWVVVICCYCSFSSWQNM